MSGPSDLARLTVTIDTANELFLSEVPEMIDVGGGVMRPTNAKVLADLATQMGGAMIYTSVSLGMAGTANQGYFSVISPDGDEYLLLYRNDSGTPAFIDSYPNASKVRALSVDVEGVDSRLSTTEVRTGGVYGRKIPNTGFVVVDSKSGKCLWTDDQGRTHSISHDTLRQMINGVEQIPQVKMRAKGTQYAFAGADLRALVVVRDNGLIEVSRLNVIDLLINGKPIAASIADNLNDAYTRDGELLKYHANPLSVSGWGSSSMERMASQFVAMTAALAPDASYYDGGKGGEQSTHIAARLGAIPLLVTVTGGVILGSGNTSVSASNANPSASLKPFTGWLNGVHGTMRATNSIFYFARTIDGDEIPTAGEFQFIPEIGPQHRGDVGYLWMGKNDAPGYSAESIIQRTDASFDWFSPFVKRCLVIGHFHDSTTEPTSLEAQILDSVNAAHKARYGDLFIDVQAYLMSDQVWIDTGINPTPADLEQQALGQKPTSLSVDNGHMSSAMYIALNENIIQPRIRQLGWY